MCELFAMSARLPTHVHLSLDELARHGGGTGPHRDGWGVAFMQQGDALVVREPSAAHDSACLRFLRQQELSSPTVVAHIRKATQGPRLLRNSQPFTRELGGVVHVFAHNGMLTGIEADPRFPTRRFRAVGDTDSEHAFCALLERMASLWSAGLPDLDARVRTLTAFAAEVRTLGPANFIYTDGDAVFAHGHRRRNEAGEMAPPGLHVLCRSCHPGAEDLNIDGVSIAHDDQQHVALLASVPLSAERWEPLREGELIVLREGRIVRREG
jgi:glutamine amidotransferase